MKTLVFTTNLKNDPALIEKYKEYHKSVCKDVIEGFGVAGLKSDRIYLLGNRLVSIMEVKDDFDIERDLKDYYTKQGRPEAEKWEKLMASFQEALPEAKDGEKWALMEKVFEHHW